MNFTWLAVLAACETAPAPDIVLVTLDTTRADRIGVYGHAEAHTPHIDALAARGLRFDRAYTTVPLTTPAHASLLTGLYPGATGVHVNGDAILPDSVTTLAERLGAHGYRSAASVSAFVTARIWNLDQGFDETFDHVSPAATRWRQERPADATVADLERWLTEPTEAPVFVWMHLYDPHQPWEAPEAWTAQVDGRPYDAEIAHADDAIGRLLAAMPDRPRVVVVVADHGEALKGEHGESSHGMFLFDETVRVPLVIVPATPLDAPIVIDTPVSVVDITPTLLAAAGLPTDGLDGVPLTATPPDRPIIVESKAAQARFGYAPEVAVIQGHYKLMEGSYPSLFDLQADPHESHNLVSKHPDLTSRLRAHAVLAASTTGDPIDAHTRSQLAALGYVSGLVTDGSGGDAKHHLRTIREVDRASALLSGGKPEAARNLLTRVLEEEPDLVEAWHTLARIRAALNDESGAAEALDRALDLAPSAPMLRIARAQLHISAREWAAAETILDALVKERPTDRDARLARLKLHATRDETDRAIDLARRALTDDPGDKALAATLGVLLARTGHVEEARPLLEEAVALGVPRPEVRTALAELAMETGDHVVAMSHLVWEVETFPEATQARRLLADLWMAEERWSQAATRYAELVALRPSDHDARRALAQAHLNANDTMRAHQAISPLLPSTDPHVLTLLANIQARAGDMATAEATFAEARRLQAAGR